MKKGKLCLGKQLLLLCLLINYSLLGQQISIEVNKPIICLGELAEFKDKCQGLPPNAELVWEIPNEGLNPSTGEISKGYSVTPKKSGYKKLIVTVRDISTRKTITTITLDSAIRVVQAPTMQISATPDNTCWGREVKFKASKTAGDGQIISYRWLISEGTKDDLKLSTADSLVHRFYPQTDSFLLYKAAVIAILGEKDGKCPSNASNFIPIKIIDPHIYPQFTPSVGAICGDLGTQMVTFTNNTPGKVVKWKWFKDGTEVSTEKSPTLPISKPATIKLIAYSENNCDYQYQADIKYYNFESSFDIRDSIPKDTVKRYWAGKNKFCPGTNLTFKANGIGKSFTAVKWSVFDSQNNLVGSADSNGYVMKNVQPGTYKITLVVSSDKCAGQGTKDTTIVVEGFNKTIQESIHVCQNVKSTINLQSTIANSVFYTDKRPRNGTPLFTSIVGEFSLGVTNIYPVPISPNGCEGIADVISVVKEAPQASFVNSRYTGCKPLVVKFKSTSTYDAKYSKDLITEYRWVFNSEKNAYLDSVSKIDSAMHVYRDTGMYYQGLIVKTRDGCIDTAKRDGVCTQIQVGTPPTFVGNVLKDSICASNMAQIDFSKSTPIGKISGISASFTTVTETVRAGGSDCGPISTSKPLDISFRNADTTGSFDLSLTVEYNGCYSSTFIPKAIFVKGPILHFSDSMTCDQPYRYFYPIDKHIWADDWKWKISKVFTINKKSVIIPIDSSVNSDTKRMVEFDKTAFLKKEDSLRFSGNYIISISKQSDTASVDGKMCAFETTINEKVRNIDLQIAFKNEQGVSRNFIGNKVGVCWSDSLLFDVTKSRDLAGVSDWFAWKNNTIDSMGKGYYVNNHTTNHIAGWNDTLVKWRKDKKLCDSSQYEFGKDSLNIHNLAIVDSARYGVYFMANTDNLRSCRDSAFFDIMAYRPKAKFSVDVVNYCASTSNPFMVKFTDLSTLKRLPNDTVFRQWITDTMYVKHSKTDIDTIIHQTIGLKQFNHPYIAKQLYHPVLIVHDAVGCADTFSLPTLVKPFLPDVRFVGPKHICLAKDSISAIGQFTMPLKTDSLYVTSLDSVQWSIGDTTSNLAIEKIIDTKISVIKWNKATLSDSKLDTLKYRFKYTNEKIPIKIESWAKAPNGQVCKNDSVYNKFSVRSIKSKIKILPSNTVACVPNYLKIYSVDTLGVSRINWSRYIAQNNYKEEPLSTLPSQTEGILFTSTEVGVDSLRLELITDYVGCEVITHTYPIYVLTNNLKKSALTPIKDTICVGDTLNFSVNDTTGLHSYKYWWDFRDGKVDSTTSPYKISHQFDRLVGNSGNYDVIFQLNTGDKNCDVTLTSTINVHGLAAEFDRGIDDNQFIGCIPFSVPFINKSYSNVDKFTQIWNFGDNQTDSLERNPTHVFTRPDTVYNVTLVLKDNVCKVKRTKQIQTLKYPIVKFNDLGMICEGSSKELEASMQLTKKYWWDTHRNISDVNSAKMTITPDTTTHFYFNSISTDDCPRRDTLLIQVQNKPYYNGAPKRPLIYVYRPNDTLFNYARKQYELMPYVYYNFNNDSIPGINYEWKPSTGLNCTNCASPNIMLTQDVGFTVTMTDNYGCFTIIDSVKMQVVKETKLSLPTAFTPNGDGDNDRAWVRGWGIREFVDLRIYNRWGQLVYESGDIKDGWDGTYNGVAQNTDTFAYIIRAKDYTNAPVMQKGYITLVR